MIQGGFADYLSEVWNWADTLPPVLIIVTLILGVLQHSLDIDSTAYQYSMQGLAAFLMWVKIFYFLRIFEATGFLVNMLLRVTQFANVFLLLYLLIHIAFGQTFYILSDKQIGINYVYMTGMGDYSMDWEEYSTNEIIQNVIHLFFFFVTILVNLVMLNILIALVSEAHALVIERSKEAFDYERNALILESEGEWASKEGNEGKICTSNEYLLVAQIDHHGEDEAEEGHDH